VRRAWRAAPNRRTSYQMKRKWGFRTNKFSWSNKLASEY